MISLEQGLEILDLATDVLAGRVLSSVELSIRIAKLAVDLVPVDMLKQHLDDEAKARIDTVVDRVEDAKFGASRVAQLQEQIAALQEQTAALQAQLARLQRSP